MAQFSFHSLRVRLLLLVELAVIAAIAVVIVTASEHRRLAATEAQETALRLARLAFNDQALFMAGGKQLLAGMAALPELRRRGSQACSEFLSRLGGKNPLYANLGVIGREGDLICSALPLSGPLRLADRAYFRRVIERRDFAASDYQVDRATGKATIHLGYPVLDEAREVRAVVFAVLDLDWLHPFAAKANLPQGSTFSVIDRNGTILFHHPDTEKWVGKIATDSFLFKTARALRVGVTEASDPDGVPRLFGFTPLLSGREAGNAYIIIGIPREVAVGPADRERARSLLILGLVGLLALVLVWVGGDLFFLRQVNALIETARRLAKGEMGARAKLSHRHGELSQMAQAFNEMAGALEERTAELESSNELKDEFLSAVAHETRTLLNIVTGHATMLKDGTHGDINPKQEEVLGKVIDRIDKHLSTIDNILHATVLEAGKTKVERSEMRLVDFLDQLRLVYDTPIKKELALNWDYPPNLPKVKTDIAKLEQILQNLIDNAIKFTEKGHVTISVRYLPIRGAVEFKVADSGVGISQKTLRTIFRKFRQVDSKETRIYGEAGTGLYVVKEFTEMLRGKFEVASEPGRGSTFTVTIPREI